MSSVVDFTIRNVEEKDVGAISQLAHRIWRQHYTPIIGEEQVEYMLNNWYSHAFLKSQVVDKERLFLTAELKGELVGYIQSSQHDGMTFIHKLYIAQEVRGRGIGRSLLEAIPQDKPLRLRVNRQNIDSVAFYQRYGFEIIDKSVLDIGNDFVMDDYIMQRLVFTG